jgi:hypothetical protein
MAVLTISLTGAGSLTNITKTLSAGDLTKLIDAFTPILQAQGVPSPTNQQIFAYWVDRWKADTITAVRQQQQTLAQVAIADIALT